MKYTDKQYAETLAKMCNNPGYGENCPSELLEKIGLNFICINNLPNTIFCVNVKSKDWLEYLRRHPIPENGQKRG